MADGTHHYQAAMSTTVTTTGNIDNLDIDGAGMLVMNNASAATIRGIAAGYHGKRLVIVAVGAGTVTLNHQDTNSSVANRIITPVAAAMPIQLAVLTYDGVNARWRLTAVTVNGQIQFPATQNASSDVNTLDDYEEGSWTPVIGGTGGTSGQTYLVQTGRYTKIGKIVAVMFESALSNKGTITGNVQISGLPFTAEGTPSRPVYPMQWAGLGTNWVFICGLVLEGTATILVRGAAAAGTTADTSLVTADITNSTFFRGAAVYMADN